MQLAANQDGSPIAHLPPVTHAECLTLRNILLRTNPASQWEAGFIESMVTLLQQAAQGGRDAALAAGD
ncbi:MAG TPA: hypothetical protein VGC15_16915 [Acetobacteraceae bacterium]